MRFVALAVAFLSLAAGAQKAPADLSRVEGGRFTVVAFPGDMPLARSLLALALAHDTFPGLPRPTRRTVVAIAPDARRFREWIGPSAPEWGAAIADPEAGRVVMQGHNANTSAGDPAVTLRHELAHLALHEAIGNLPPRWFDEGYASLAAGEADRDDVLATNVALVWRGPPRLDELDAFFTGGPARAQTGYALAQRAVSELAALDPARGLALFFAYWKTSRSFDAAIRQAYGMTEPAFETRWRSAIRLRYGALALVADTSFAVALMLAVLAPFWLIRRRRDRMRMAQLRAADEAQERREREDLLAALLGEPSTAAGDSPEKNARLTPTANDDLVK